MIIAEFILIFVFTEKYLNVSISEIVMAFMFRGNHMSQWKQRRYNNKISRMLGFTTSNYRNRAPSFLFGNGIVEVSATTHQLIYTGDFQYGLQQCLLPSTMFEGIGTLLKLRDGQCDVEIVVASFFECFLVNAGNIYNCQNMTVARSCEFTKFYNNITVVHSTEFIKMISELGEHALAGNALIRNARSIVGRDTFQNNSFLEIFSRYFDSRLLKEVSPFLFPVSTLKRLYIVLPICFNDQELAPMLKLYNFAFYMKYHNFNIRWMYYSNVLSQIVHSFKYIDFAYWAGFNNMDRVFCKVFQASEQMNTTGQVISVNFADWFD